MNYKNFNKQKGFTLIELMVVIAIIGILSAIIYTSISAARAKGANGSAKIAMANILVQAKLYYYGNNQSYDRVCYDDFTQYPTLHGGVKSINDILVSAAKAIGLSNQDVVQNSQGYYYQVTCNSSHDFWVAEVPLRGSDAGPGNAKMYCVDSTGAQIEQSKNISAGSLNCQTSS